MTGLQFAVSLILIVGASELFTNAVEWAGFRLNLGSVATGSLLAAIGTSLPEMTVPVVALATHANNANAVAIGAVLGAPLLLLTLGVGFTAVAVMTRRQNRSLTLNRAQARRDLSVFIAAFTVGILAAILNASSGVRIVAGIVLVIGYALYVRATLAASSEKESTPEPLHIIRWDADRRAGSITITVQLLIAVGLLVAASDLFVAALDNAAAALHFNPLIVAVVLVPIATELPETLNSVLWVRSNDDGLAFGNVAGSSVFQACLLGAIGLCFTTWTVGNSGLLSMGLTLATAVYLLCILWRGQSRGVWLLPAALPWAAYVVMEVATHGNL